MVSVHISEARAFIREALKSQGWSIDQFGHAYTIQRLNRRKVRYRFCGTNVVREVMSSTTPRGQWVQVRRQSVEDFFIRLVKGETA